MPSAAGLKGVENHKRAVLRQKSKAALRLGYYAQRAALQERKLTRFVLSCINLIRFIVHSD